jgi:hypothetical protein
MIRKLLLFLLVAMSLLYAQTPADPHSARTALDQGVLAYKQARFEDAINAFRQAISLDAELLDAHFYLAVTLSTVYIPGADSVENNSYAEQAIAEYNRFIDANPPDDQMIRALKGIAYLHLQTKKFEDSKDVYEHLVRLDPDDPENYYCIGVIDWTQTYQPRMQMRNRLKLESDQPLNSYPECTTIRELNADKVADGISMFSKAIELRPDYDDAMAYLNLMYRERADIACGDLYQREQDLKIADEWVDKTMAIKKAKAERSQRRPSPETSPQH